MAHLTLDDHERLAKTLLMARAYVAQVTAMLVASYPKHVDRLLHQGLGACLRELDRAREALCEVLTHEHRHLHPAHAKRTYYPLIDAPPAPRGPGAAR